MDQPEDTTGHMWHPPRDAITTTTGGSRDDLCSEETASERIDKALETLKAELVAMRQQDVQLLKQLLHISQNIRRLKHVRCSKSGLGDSSRAARTGQFSAHAQTEVGGQWKLPCQQQHLNECVTALRSPQVTSTSSIDDISNEEEVDSQYGSATDLDLKVTSPCASPDANKMAAGSPTSITSLAFTHAELCGGDFSYAELLKRNVRLWKWSVGHEREYLAWGQLSCVL